MRIGVVGVGYRGVIGCSEARRAPQGGGGQSRLSPLASVEMALPWAQPLRCVAFVYHHGNGSQKIDGADGT